MKICLVINGIYAAGGIAVMAMMVLAKRIWQKDKGTGRADYISSP